MKTQEEVGKYVELLMRINYWDKGLRANEHFRLWYDDTRRFFETGLR